MAVVPLSSVLGDWETLSTNFPRLATEIQSTAITLRHGSACEIICALGIIEAIRRINSGNYDISPDCKPLEERIEIFEAALEMESQRIGALILDAPLFSPEFDQLLGDLHEAITNNGRRTVRGPFDELESRPLTSLSGKEDRFRQDLTRMLAREKANRDGAATPMAALRTAFTHAMHLRALDTVEEGDEEDEAEQKEVERIRNWLNDLARTLRPTVSVLPQPTWKEWMKKLYTSLGNGTGTPGKRFKNADIPAVFSDIELRRTAATPAGMVNRALDDLNASIEPLLKQWVAIRLDETRLELLGACIAHSVSGLAQQEDELATQAEAEVIRAQLSRAERAAKRTQEPLNLGRKRTRADRAIAAANAESSNNEDDWIPEGDDESSSESGNSSSESSSSGDEEEDDEDGEYEEDEEEEKKTPAPVRKNRDVKRARTDAK
jgi:hypothetical protein